MTKSWLTMGRSLGLGFGALAVITAGIVGFAPVSVKYADEALRSLYADRAAQLWTTYMATYLTPEEAELAKNFHTESERYVQQALVPVAEALRAGEHERAQALINSKISQLSPPMQLALDKLTDLNVRMAKNIDEEESARATTANLLLIMLLGAVAVWRRWRRWRPRWA